ARYARPAPEEIAVSQSLSPLHNARVAESEASRAATTPLLEVKGLQVSFDTETGRVTPILDAAVTVYPGQTMALVGESGSGKSVTSLAVMGLLPRPAGRITAGTIHYQSRTGGLIDLA